MKEFKFTCAREMIGDREYATGDTRELSAVDAAHLVRSGALVPADAEARAAMEQVFADMPDTNYGIVHAPAKAKDAGSAPLDKDAGAAPLDKDAGKAPATKATTPKPVKPAKPAKAKDETPPPPAEASTPPGEEVPTDDKAEGGETPPTGEAGGTVNAAAANGGKKR